jgi:hypothetical protein
MEWAELRKNIEDWLEKATDEQLDKATQTFGDLITGTESALLDLIEYEMEHREENKKLN